MLASAATLPAGQVDGLQAGLHLLHRLVAGHRAERVHERFVVDQAPQLFGAAARERVLDVNRAAQPDHLFGGVAALNALPARVLRPVLLQSCRFEVVAHFRLLPSFVVANPAASRQPEPWSAALSLARCPAHARRHGVRFRAGLEPSRLTARIGKDRSADRAGMDGVTS
jgi:hypothetical protein